jgi:hypothetical protein
LQQRWLGLFLVALVAIIAMQISSGSVTLRGGRAIKRAEAAGVLVFDRL